MYHNILIVDDETHVTDALQILLMDQPDLDCEVYTANTAAEALMLIERCRIDLIITDIQMPDMTGLELLREVKGNWPDCQAIMLTGYSDFESVYEAFQLKASGFILKTESDEQILQKVREVLLKIEIMLNQNKLFPSAVRFDADPRLLEALQGQGCRKELLTEMNIDSDQDMILCLCSGLEETAPEETVDTLNVLMHHYFQRHASTIVYNRLEEPSGAVWLFQDRPRAIGMSMVCNILEIVQNSYHATTGLNFSCIIDTTDAARLAGCFQTLRESAAAFGRDKGRITTLNTFNQQYKSSDYTIRFVKNYITEHIADDISIPSLADITGYNADYLSRTFRRVTGVTIKQYIADIRIALIRQYLLEDSVSIDELYKAVGFSSRTYFNRFVKRETGMSPRVLRIKVQEE